MTRPIGLEDAHLDMHETKRRLIDAGLRLMLANGYHALGVQQLLAETRIPKGSFYHHFESKEDFALQVIDAYTANVHALLDVVLSDRNKAPLDRVRNFFENVRLAYEAEGYLGCFLGALGQELSGASDLFRRKIEGCLADISSRLAETIADAKSRGDLPANVNPREMADVLVDAWEGAALRTRLVRSGRPLDAVLNFYFTAVRPT